MNGLVFIQRQEGCRLDAYLCEAKRWTIGYGHTGPDVKPGLHITQDEADQLFLRDLQRYADGVTLGLNVDVTPDQFSALVSLAYNIGVGAFIRSQVLSLVNAGAVIGAACAFLQWRHVRGKVSPGLLKRRWDECELFLKGAGICI
jgi:lysozyme